MGQLLVALDGAAIVTKAAVLEQVGHNQHDQQGNNDDEAPVGQDGNARLTKQVQALLVVHTERDALVNQRDAKAENHGQDAHVDEQEANETAGQHTEQHAENQNANTAKVQGQRDVTADDTGQVHLGASGGIHTANGKVAVQAQRKAEGRDQVAHQGGVVYRGIQGVHAAEGEVQQLHDKPHRCRNCHSKCSVHEQNVFFLKGLPVAHCFSLLIRSGVPPQTFCGDQPIISLIFS